MKVTLARILTLILTAALAAVVVYWIFMAERESKLLLYLIALAPLLPWVRGLLHGTPKAHMGVAVVSLLYLLHGSVEAFTAGSMLGWLEAVIALILMFSASMYARWSRQA